MKITKQTKTKKNTPIQAILVVKVFKVTQVRRGTQLCIRVHEPSSAYDFAIRGQSNIPWIIDEEIAPPK